MIDDGKVERVARTFFDAGNAGLLCARRDGSLVERSVLGGTAMVSDCLIGANHDHVDGGGSDVCMEEES